VETAKRVEKLRKKYERELAASESQRIAYHQAVVDLLQRGGPDLRNLAEELGLLAEPVQQEILIASKPRRRRRRRLAQAAAGLAAVLLLCALTLGALRVAQAPPFAPMVRVPRVMNMPEAIAVRRLRAAGLNVRVILYRRSIPTRLFHRVLGVSHPAGTRASKDSTVTLYVVVQPKRG